MTSVGSNLGRRQFLISAGMAPASIFALGKIAELFGPKFQAGSVMAAERSNR